MALENSESARRSTLRSPHDSGCTEKQRVRACEGAWCEQRLAESVTTLTHNPLVVLAILNLILFVLGLFLHGAAAIILVVPVVLPLIKAVGIDPIHFGIIVTLNIAVGQADTAGGQRAHGLVLDCQGQYLGNVQA